MMQITFLFRVIQLFLVFNKQNLTFASWKDELSQSIVFNILRYSSSSLSQKAENNSLS